MTPPGDARGLTPGEAALAARLFGDALDPAPVRLHRRRWWPLQRPGTVMAPDGHLWFHPRCPLYREDYSQAGRGLRGLFVHELTHVWQYQSGRNLIAARGLFARYRYRLVPGKPLEGYGIEQQAEIIRDAYLLGEGAAPPDAPPRAAYAAVLPFILWT
ncbi:vgr related protein [Parapedomonas caeni]